MGSRIRRVMGTVLLLAAAVFWIQAFRLGRLAEAERSVVQVRFADSSHGPTGKQLEEIRQMEAERQIGPKPDISGWNMEEDVEIRSTVLPKKLRGLCINVSGRKEQAVKGMLLKGSYGLAEDREGCLISRKTALELFGTMDIIGQTVYCRDQYWIIRGILNSGDPLILLPDNSSETFPFLSISYEDGKGGTAGAGALLFRYGLDADVVSDGSLRASLIRMTVWLPGWMGIFLAYRWIKGCWNRRRIRAAAAAGAVVLSVLIFTQAFRIPQEWIPARWSDFGFWSERMRETRDRYHMFRMIPWITDLQWQMQTVLTAAMAASSVVCQAGSFRIWKGISREVKK